MKGSLRSKILLTLSLTVCLASDLTAQQGTWTQQIAGTNCYINAVHFTEYCCSDEADVLGWYVGWCATSGVLQTSEDGGEFWMPAGFFTTVYDEALYDVHFIEHNDTVFGWVVGTNGYVMRIIRTELS